MSPDISRTGAKSRVLVVDDENEIRRFLRIGLEAYGYEVIEARSGETALQQSVTGAPQIMILDLGLPDMEGHEVVRQLREWSQIPVIVLSVRSGVDDKILALDAGANDYVVKPFDIRELHARLRAQLRDHTDEPDEATFEARGLRLDCAARTVTIDGVPVQLTKKEYELLALLARHAGRVVTHTQILEKLWGACPFRSKAISARLCRPAKGEAQGQLGKATLYRDSCKRRLQVRRVAIAFSSGSTFSSLLVGH